MPTTKTGSIIERADGSNRTGTALSTNILVMVGSISIGALQSVQITEQRPIGMINEVGSDMNLDSTPTASAKFSASCERIRFDRMRVAEAFARGFLHVHAQRVPFDVVIIDQWNGDNESAIITTLKNCWISQISYTYSASNYIITDNMNLEFEAIYSTLGTGGLNAATGGDRGIPLAINAIEQEADRGVLRGSLDQPGLLNAVTTPF